MMVNFQPTGKKLPGVKAFIPVLFVIIIILGCVKNKDIAMSQSVQHRIKITISGKELTATLNDSKTTRDFISLLPLDLTLEDYASTEKISYLPEDLTTEDAPNGSDPSVGDITYYAPWGNLAVFYKDFGYSKGLIILGKIDNGIENLIVEGSVNAKFELIKNE